MGTFLQRAKTAQNPHTYFNARMEALGIPPENALEYGFKPDARGNIQQLIRSFAGKQRLYLDKSGTNNRRIELQQSRKTHTEGGGLERYEKPLFITRINPANLRPGDAKYLYPAKWLTGYGVFPIPCKTAIKAFNAGTRGGIAVGIEGAFKSAALDVGGVEAVAFSGITTYRVCADMAEYIEARQLDSFVILYDADARELNAKPGKPITAKRVFDFYASARRFASEFYDLCERKKLKTQLYFAMVGEGTGFKGVDDLLEGTGRAQVIEAFKTLQTSAYFTFLKLDKKRYNAELEHFFRVKNHVDFYNAYASEIGTRDFEFAHAEYRIKTGTVPADLFSPAASTFFELLNHPANIGTPAEMLSVDKYLTEVRPQLDNALEAYARVCIAAPTGTGKNAYFLGHKTNNGKWCPGYFERLRIAGVITVPTVSLAKQLSRKFKVPGIYGRVTIRDKESALGARVVVCTYDTIQHIGDLSARVLVVDECHNLVNQWGNVKKNNPFRADTLQRLIECMDVARQTVLISGTPPRLLANHYGFKMINVARRKNPIARVFAIEAKTRSAQALTAEACAQLDKLDLNDGRIRFVYLNSRKQLETIREYLINRGIQKTDIAVISREHVLDGTHEVYNGIIETERIEGARLVLSTCLIAEGLNINNTNIGEIITVNTSCPDSFAQYIARFRNMPNLTVLSIRPPERRLDKRFFVSAEIELRYQIERAELQKRLNELSQYEHYGQLAELDADLIEYADDIQPGYPYRAQLLTNVYRDANGKWKVATLRILAGIRERFNDLGNNTSFYAQISQYANIEIMGHGDTDAQASEAAAEGIREAAAAIKVQKSEGLKLLKNSLQTCPAVVVAAYHTRLKKSQNRHTSARVEVLASDLLNAPEATGGAVFAAQHSELFCEKYFTDAINRYIRARFARGDIGEALAAIDIPAAKFGRIWARWRQTAAEAIYNDKRARVELSPEHKAEIKFYLNARGAIAQAAQNDKINLSEVVKILRARCAQTSADPRRIIYITRIDAKMAERILETVFECNTEALPSGEKVFTIRPAAALNTRHIVKNAKLFVPIL